MTRLSAVRLYFLLRKKLREQDEVTFDSALDLVAYTLGFFYAVEKNAYFKALYKQQRASILAFRALLSSQEDKEDIMADLGITPGEIMSALPTLLSEAWGYFSDDKKITGDEGVLLVATTMELMAERTDSPEYAEFFGAQAAAFRIFATLIEQNQGE